MSASLALAAPASPASNSDKAASAKAVSALSGTLLSTIASLPVTSKEQTFEAQLAADVEGSGQPQEVIVRAIRASLLKVCPPAKVPAGGVSLGASVLNLGQCHPRAAGEALLILLKQRALKTRALDNGATSPFNDPNFNGGGGGSNYVP